MRHAAALALCAAGSGCALADARAQAFPAKPVRVLIGFAPGGGSDILGRALSAQLGEQLGQPFVVENRTGAGGAIATEAVARAAPDGYTLLIGSAAAFTINPHLAKLAYDPVRDFAPIAPFATIAYVVSVHPSVPARSIQELVALARRRPGTLNYGSAGNGAATHLATEQFAAAARVQLTHVPYKGGGPALTALLAGEVDLLFDPFLTTLPHAKSGRLRPLAVTAARRSPLFPDLPTVAESGLAGYESGNWFGLFAPAGTPGAAVERLAAAVQRALGAPAMRERMFSQGADPLAGGPADLAALVQRESARNLKIIREAAIRAD